MRAVCFGDSNTYGYDPRSLLGGRYPEDSRWVDLLAAKTGWKIINLGENGRCIPRGPVAVPAGTGLFMVMLGTNDLLQGRTPEETTRRMAAFLQTLPLRRETLLLIAPPPMTFGEWVPEKTQIDASRALARLYRRLAEELDIRFADGGDWGVTLAYDGVHFTGQGHRAFAEGLYRALAR